MSLGHRNVFDYLLDISHVWEEERILVLWLWPVVSVLKLSHHLPESLQNFLIVVRLHLFTSDREQLVHRGYAMLHLILLVHLREVSAQVLEICFILLKIFGRGVLAHNLVVHSLNHQWFAFRLFGLHIENIFVGAN